MTGPIDRLLSTWLKNTNCSVLLIDNNDTCTMLNQCQSIHLTRDAASSTPFHVWDFIQISNEERPALINQLEACRNSGMERKLRLPTSISPQQVQLFDWSFTPVPSQEGEIPQLLAIGSPTRFSSEIMTPRIDEPTMFILENLPMMVVALGSGESLLVWNKAAEDVTGYSRAELRDSRELFESLVLRRDEMHEVQTNGGKHLEREITTKDGLARHIQWILLSELVPIPDFTLWAIGYDVTEHYQVDFERQQLQLELFRAQKMESIGTLAGGVAHDFNNILVGILGYASLLQTILPAESEAFLYAQDIGKSAQRMSKLTRQLMVFSRGGKFEPVATNINIMITNIITFISRTLDPSISIITDFEEPPPLILADPVQLQQVIVNLVSNSAESMQQSGIIKITTRSRIVIREMGATTHTQLIVEDNGSGMDAFSLDKIFEPFYSTKAHGRGLGMAVVNRIVKIHNGEIQVESEVGRGTRVTISFPATQKPAEPEMGASSVQLTAGTESILVIDDEKVTLDIMKFSLERVGYKIYTAIDGRSGMDILKHHNEIDLIILDVVMPGIAGVMLFKRLKKIKPGVKILLCSGFDETGPVKDIMSLGANGFLHKPFEVSLLTDIIKKILDENN
ncbi:MAG: hybrid sensor histidine kinase/response regulator [Candidatus Zhuqueibacterota bacterium]